MNNRISLSFLIELWSKIHSLDQLSIKSVSSEIEFHFLEQPIDEIIRLLKAEDILVNQGRSFFSIKRKYDDKHIQFYTDLKHLLSSLSTNTTITDTHDLFVFDFDGKYLFHDYLTKDSATNSSLHYASSILKHQISYSKLLGIFKLNIPTLAELDRINNAETELIILSKGTENFITNIKYKKVDNSIFGNNFIRIPIEELQLKLINDEWIASFKSVLCNYMELQNDDQKTFATLYKNLTFLVNQTNKNYELFISKFSFEKIRKQFKAEKTSYFDNLSNAQDKISSQIVSVPISLGASIFSFYQLSTNFTTILLVYFAILIYALFIIVVICGYLKDVNKLAKDVNEEHDNLKNYYHGLLSDFASDFTFMESKRRYIRFLGWSIICALIITLLTITYYIMTFNVESDISIKYL